MLSHTGSTMKVVKTYREEFPFGTRVVVRASVSEGTDGDFNGRYGTVVEHGQFMAVEFDRPIQGYPNPYLISPHNLHKVR